MLFFLTEFTSSHNPNKFISSHNTKPKNPYTLAIISLALQSVNTSFSSYSKSCWISRVYVWTFSIVILYQHTMICHQTKLTLFAQNHFQDCPQYPLSCEKCGKENIARNEVSSFLLERWCTLSDLTSVWTTQMESAFCMLWLASL